MPLQWRNLALLISDNMQKSFVLACVVCGASGMASAQTPAGNPMPDGSRDMYIGLGVISRPSWEGASNRKDTLLPVLQVQWSNGVFVSGMSAGMHLSHQPSIEYGPLVALHPRRNHSGVTDSLDGASPEAGLADGRRGAGPITGTATGGGASMEGMDPIKARLLAGAFFNSYLSERLRLSNRVLYGAGNHYNGLLYTLDLQRLAGELGSKDKLSASIGVTIMNRAYGDDYFGVSESESLRSGNPQYQASGGLKDVHAGVRWSHAFSPSWLLTSHLQVMHLQRDAAHSPLVERPVNYSVSAALAYRF